ncbi:MAG TPA: Fic family protein [Methanocellales archaeon]|nr:Fic family protein [Methanocellales archaeon]
MFDRIREKKTHLDEMRPLPTDSVKKLREELRLLHTYHSNAIEGNTLTLSETKLILEEGITIGGKSLKEHLEMTNTAEAYDYIERLTESRKPLTNEVVQEVHGMVSKGILEDAGKYRTTNVRITGAAKTPPSYMKVPKLMGELLEDIKKSTHDPVTTAALLHHGIVAVHPFVDGNGRVARLITNLHLMQYGYLPVVLRKEDRKKYYETLRKADLGDTTAFINFVAKSVAESLNLYFSLLGGDDELLPLRELAKGSPYGQEYLSLLARRGVLDAVKINGVWHATRRALKKHIPKKGR